MEGLPNASPPSSSPTRTHRKRLSSAQIPKLVGRSISADQDYGLGRMGSYDRAQVRGTMQAQQDFVLQPPQPANDGSLLLASLDQAPVEDEAEATLLHVLERRQNVMSQMLPMDQMPITPAPFARTLPPSKSKRHLFQTAAKPVTKPNTQGQGVVEESQLRSSFTDQLDLSQVSTGSGGLNPTPSQDTSRGGLSGPSRNQHPPLPRPPLISHGRRAHTTGRHRRALTSLPNAGNFLGSLTGVIVPESTQSSVSGASGSSPALPSGFAGLSASAERARQVAITIKAANPSAAMASNNLDQSTSLTDEGVMPDLVNIMEAKRERDEDNSSRASGGSGSRNRSARGSHADGKSGDGTRSIGSKSADSGGHKAKARHRRRMPFAGISSPFSRDQDPMSHVEQLFQVAENIEELFGIPEGEENDEKPLGNKAGESFYSHASDHLETANSNFLANLFQSHPEPAPIPFDEEDPEQQSGDDSDGSGEESDEQSNELSHGQIGRRADERTPMLNKVMPRIPSRMLRHSYFRQKNRFGKIGRWFRIQHKQFTMLVDAFDTPFVLESLWSFLQNQFSYIVVPALAVAYYIFYFMGNPSSKFLPTDATDTWCILFAIRSYLTLQLAFATEYLIVDVLAMRSPLSVKLIGPLATLYTIQAKGWPFVVTMWGVWNFLLLYGEKPFYYHWLFFTNIDMFTVVNDGNTLLSSSTYREILLSMIFAGVATSIKRTVIALYLGKRVFNHYKPKLEKLMIDMLLLAEVAELASALDDFEFERIDNQQVEETHKSTKKSSGHTRDAIRASTMQDIVQQKLSAHPGYDSEEEGDADLEYSERSSTRQSEARRPTQWSRLRTLSDYSGEDINPNAKPEIASQAPEKLQTESEGKIPTSNERTQSYDWDAVGGEDVPPPPTEGFFPHQSPAGDVPPVDFLDPPAASPQKSIQGIMDQDTSAVQIKALLDRWEEPVNKQDKASDPTIHEILQFRKALSFLDDTHPFSLAFGPAFTRDHCIKSSKRLYKRLLEFSPGSTVMHFDVLGVLAFEQDGSFDEKKAKGLVRLFRPDKFDEVTLLAFVQSCDLVYKKLRYLRASVGNSTLIDHVLEDIFNVFFNFFLVLVIMSILELNPWALFVSMSTIVVSFAFALGPSAAKLIEGMIMIAIRRPFDLGDRISFVSVTDKSSSGDPGFRDTWIVEDCNLFTTTLRLARTNEVSTVNNGSIANTRIVNHGRSNNATVNIPVLMRIEATHDHIQIFKSALEQYVSDNPRVWACLDSLTLTATDPDKQLISFTLKMQHVKQWQEYVPVLQARGDLDKFCIEILTKLGIQYTSPHGENDIFIKEAPSQGLAGELIPSPSSGVPPLLS